MISALGITHNVPQIHAGRDLTDKLPTRVAFHPDSYRGYFPVNEAPKPDLKGKITQTVDKSIEESGRCSGDVVQPRLHVGHCVPHEVLVIMARNWLQECQSDFFI